VNGQVLTVNAQTSPAPLPAGISATVGVSSAPGNARDWIGLFRTSDPDTAYLEWRYLSGTTAPPPAALNDASFAWTLPVAPGAYEFRLFTNDSFTRVAAIDFTVIASTAAIAVNGVSPPDGVTAVAGEVVSISVTGGPANRGDWIALAQAGAEATSYLSWQYLSGTTSRPNTGAASATLQAQMPSTPGSYEIRLFADDGFGLLATGPTVVVGASGAQLGVNSVPAPGAVSAGAASPLTVSVSGAPGNTGDWIGLFPAGAPDQGYLEWSYLSGTQTPPTSPLTAATLTFNAPVAAGVYEFRLFANTTFDRLTTSGAVTIAASPATVTVNDTSAPSSVNVTPGGALAIHVAGGPANTTDWIALAAAGSPDTSYLTWQYLSGTTTPPPAGLATADIGLTAPEQPGTYEVRLFANNGFARLAASGQVVVPSAECTYTFDPPSPALTAAAQSGSLTVTTQDGCAWTASTTTGWISLTTASGQSTGTVTFDLMQNISGLPRVGSMQVAGQAIAITQAGVPLSGAVTITPHLSPTPNAAGWNHTDVTVSFTCTNANSCPSPIVVSTEGAGQVVGGTASNSDSEVSASVTLNIDKAPPTAAWTTTPLTETDSATAAFGVTVTSALSGIASVTCNGQPASIASSAATCEIPLGLGQNVVIVHALNAAGGSVSLGTSVQRGTSSASASALRAAPSAVTLAVGGQRGVQLTDDLGRFVDTSAWATSDAAIASVSSDGVILGVRPGTTTVTATVGGLSASVNVTVVAGSGTGTDLPIGTTQWNVAATAGYLVDSIQRGMPGMNGTTFAFERSLTGGDTRVTAIDDDGALLWSVPTPVGSDVNVNLAMGDALGGVFLGTSGYTAGNFSEGIVRLTADGVGSWRRDGAQIEGQAGDGTIYALEFSEDGDTSWIVLLDGETGAEKGRVELARSTQLYIYPQEGDREWYSEWTGGFTKLAIDKDGNARVLVESSDLTERIRSIDEPTALPPAGPYVSGDGETDFGVVTWTTRLELWTVTQSGDVTRVLLASDTVNGTARSARNYTAYPPLLVPDDEGTALTIWLEFTAGGFEGHFARTPLGAGGPTVLPLLTGSGGPLTGVMGEGNTLFVTDRSSITSVDATTGSVRWSQTADSIVASTTGGGVVVRDYDQSGSLFEKAYDADGVLVSASPVPAADLTIGLDMRLAASTSVVSSLVSNPLTFANVGWNVVGGSAMAGQGATNCQPPPYDPIVTLPPVALDYALYTTGGNFLNFTPADILVAAQRWTSAGYPHIAPATFMAANVEIRWFTFLSNTVMRPTSDTLGRSEFPLTATWNFMYKDYQDRLKERKASPTDHEHFGIKLSSIFSGQHDLDTWPGTLANPKIKQFETTVTHEFGHLIGLNHPPENCGPGTSIMIYAGADLTPGDLTVLTELDKKAVLARLAKRRY
jgi:hypothetical protein